jgi:hypothetical protein
MNLFVDEDENENMETDDDVDVGVENEVNMEGMNDMRKRK